MKLETEYTDTGCPIFPIDFPMTKLINSIYHVTQDTLVVGFGTIFLGTLIVKKNAPPNFRKI